MLAKAAPAAVPLPKAAAAKKGSTRSPTKADVSLQQVLDAVPVLRLSVLEQCHASRPGGTFSTEPLYDHQNGGHTPII